MEKILLLLHTDENGALPKAALEAVETARGLACGLKESTWTVGLVGQDVQPAANAIAACGAGKFLGVTGDEFATSRYATDAAAAEAIAKSAEATVIIAPATSRWMRALPGVAQRLGGVVDTHAVGTKVEDGVLSVQRWYYRQRIEDSQTRSARPWMILTDTGAWSPWSGHTGEAAVEAVAVEIPESLKRTSVEGLQAPEADEQTIRPDADLLFVAGAGWTKKQGDGAVHSDEASDLILDFVRTTKSSLGSSKSLVDLSGEGQAVLPFLTHLHQVGQTGSTPRHPKGLATCCHGEEPHVVGWRFINDRRAINTDPNCGWAHGKADILYVADAFAVMRELKKLLV
jgi:electron transfer flavoprotein alpha subunit